MVMILWVPETRSGCSVNLSELASGSLVGERARRSWRVRDVLAGVGVVQAAWRYSLMSPPQVGCRLIGCPGRYSTTPQSPGALPEAAVGSVRVVVLDVLAQELFELAAVPDQGAVEELAAHGADPAFRVRVRDRCAWWRADDGRAVAAEDLVERGDELAGAVADQEPDRAVVAHHEVPGCLGRPGAGRVGRDPGEVHAAAVEFDEEQHVVAAQHDGVDGEEVTARRSRPLGHAGMSSRTPTIGLVQGRCPLA